MSHSDWSEITLCLRQSGLIFGGVFCLWGKQKHKELFALSKGVWVWAFLQALNSHMLHPRSHRHTHISTHPHARLHLCFCHSSNWRQSMLCISLSTMINTSPHIFERHYQHSHCCRPSKHAHTHTNACARHTVVVVHCSFIHVEGFMLGLVKHHSSAHSLLPCHSPRDSSTTSPQLWLCNTLASFTPKVLLLWATFQPLCITSRHWTAFLWRNIIVALYSYEITVPYYE